MHSFQQFIIACVGIVVFVYISRITGKTYYYKKNGIPATAAIIKITNTGISHGQGTGSRPVMEMVLLVNTEGGQERKITAKQDFGTPEIPKENDLVNIFINPKDENKVLIMSNITNGRVYLR